MVDEKGLAPSRLMLEQSSDQTLFSKISSCNQFKVKTSSKTDLKINMAKHHKIRSSNSEKVYDCSLCDEHVNTNDKFKEHIEKHIHDIKQLKQTIADLKKKKI